MLALVGWVLKLTPIGVFALALPLGARMGASAAGALVYYIVLLSLVSGGLHRAGALPGGDLAGRRVRFAGSCEAAAPRQAVAFSSRSSLAALPADLEGHAR